MTFFQITCDDEILYDPRSKDRQVLSPKVILATNASQSLSFIIPKTNPCYTKIEKRKSVIRLFRINKTNNEFVKKQLFRGVVYNESVDFLGRKSIDCEFEIVFLNDSIVRRYSWKGAVSGFFNFLITQHNNQVDKFKQFIPRKCTVIDNNDYIVRANENYPNTKNEAEEKLIGLMGGHFEFEEINNINYIDYLLEYEKVNTQPITFNENLLDINQYITAENVVTRIIPLGQKNENGDYLTIAEVNNKIDYLEDDAAIALFGIISDIVVFEDVTKPQNLLNKGKQALEKNLDETITINISAIDLNVLNVNVAALEVGAWTRIISKPHDLDRLFLLSKAELYLDDLKSSTFTFGASPKTYTKKQNSIINNIKNIDTNIQFAVKQANAAILKSEDAMNTISNVVTVDEIEEMFDDN